MQKLVSKTFINLRLFYILLVFIPLSLKINHLFAQNKLKTVIIDAGHGGKDPGAVGKLTKEKDIALAISLKLGFYIKKYIPGVKVIYTRKTDTFVELKERAEMANRNHADLMISIHVNSSPNKHTYGTSTYIMGLGKSDDNLYVALKENASLKYESNVKERYKEFHNDTMPNHIVNALAQSQNLEFSIYLANLIQNQFKKRVGRKDLGIKQDNLVVLWYTTMPSVLIETGFISNESEEKFLKSKLGQDYMASAIFRAFRDYKQKYDSGKIFLNTGKPEKYISGEVVFYVQIRSTVKQIPLDSKEFKGIKGVKEIKYGNRYNYVVGHEYELKKAIERQNRVRKKIKDAYIIATYKGKIISMKEAKKILAAN